MIETVCAQVYSERCDMPEDIYDDCDELPSVKLHLQALVMTKKIAEPLGHFDQTFCIYDEVYSSVYSRRGPFQVSPD